ncbi:MAG: divergent PAP2 family protein [Clostridia bacterium]|nr:divergent PAP2 family protein [Clostridia bacterium]
MAEFFKLIISNHILNTGVISWFLAQSIKGIIESVRARKILIERFFGSGGMPSSHSSLVTSVLTMVYLTCGVASPEFAITAVFWFITTYDAANVRYAVGEQAKIINQIIMIDERVEREKLFKELMGHTKTEIFFGCLLGLAVALIYWALFIL